jgi:SNF2 family DNA or RNA helicase
MVSIGMKAFDKAGIKATRITGAENKEDVRRKNQKTFQDPDSGTTAIWITNAGNDAINLQAAEALIFYDTPFSGGDYLQTIGRMIRIGSIHATVIAIHLIVRGTIDEKTQKITNKKLDLIERVLGKRLQGDTNGDDIVEDGSELGALFDELCKDARSEIIHVR